MLCALSLGRYDAGIGSKAGSRVNQRRRSKIEETPLAADVRTRTKLRSAEWFGKTDRDGFAHRSWMKNQGLPHHLFDGPRWNFR